MRLLLLLSSSLATALLTDKMQQRRRPALAALSRRELGSYGAAAALLAPQASHAAERYITQNINGEKVRVQTGEKTGFDLSKREELLLFDEEELSSWPEKWPFTRNDFRRLDESDDSLFYPAQAPKFVYHIDEGAVAALTNYYKDRIKPGSKILDICSSWVSHYPREFTETMSEIVGTGINDQELRANSQLSSYVARDLNKEPTLPFPENSFDVVTCVVSVDYLTQPLEILTEVRRVLKPGGVVIFSQSNRLFYTKAVRIWLSMSDLEHLELIGKYLKYAGFTNKPRAFDVSAKNGGARDPLFIIECTK